MGISKHIQKHTFYTDLVGKTLLITFSKNCLLLKWLLVEFVEITNILLLLLQQGLGLHIRNDFGGGS